MLYPAFVAFHVTVLPDTLKGGLGPVDKYVNIVLTISSIKTPLGVYVNCEKVLVPVTVSVSAKIEPLSPSRTAN
jgi:hypothetical protein